MLKGLTYEVGSRQLYMSSFYEYLPLFEADPEGRRAATEVALCELMQSGVTTVCDLFAARDGWKAVIRTAQRPVRAENRLEPIRCGVPTDAVKNGLDVRIWTCLHARLCALARRHEGGFRPPRPRGGCLCRRVCCARE